MNLTDDSQIYEDVIDEGTIQSKPLDQSVDNVKDNNSTIPLVVSSISPKH